jgi:hypothetical protein
VSWVDVLDPTTFDDDVEVFVGGWVWIEKSEDKG